MIESVPGRWSNLVAGLRLDELGETGHLTRVAVWRGIVEFYESDDLTHAAAIAYYALLSLFPFLLIAISILGSATVDEADRQAVLSFAFRYFPRQFEFMTIQLDAFRQTRVPMGVAGSIALVWASLGVFGAVSSAVNHAWGVEKQRSFWAHRVFSFLMLAAAGAMLLVALLLTSVVHVAQASWFARFIFRFPALEVLRGFTVRYATWLLPSFIFGFIYYFVPNVRVRLKDVWLGALFTGLIWSATLEGFSWFVRDMTSFSAIHGSIAAVVVFLLWVYVSAVILLYGVEFTAAYGKMRRDLRASQQQPSTTRGPSAITPQPTAGSHG